MHWHATNRNETVNNTNIESELAHIATHSKILVQTIKTLEATSETFVKNLERITVIRGSFRNAPSVVVKKILYQS